MCQIVQNQLKNVLNARARLGEGPIWDANKQLLYWVDIYNYRVGLIHCSERKIKLKIISTLSRF
ncbi:hypothetical protein A6770_05140 [Nostoc minutum NIES-26]|uniref:SMP-30/Gluconolactonase/LRE-like region domain-containing protein n=1 Tax=Nostoc minutum NIES-26 TaxID=1844469 RepID=A0A367Q8C9_9NOSO|nr:hypothetical protein A6770_05140 [Nostoc minutum NIES-26]